MKLLLPKQFLPQQNLCHHMCKNIPICGCAQYIIGIIQDYPLGECFWSHSKLMVLHGNVVSLITQLCLQFRLHRSKTCCSRACGVLTISETSKNLELCTFVGTCVFDKQADLLSSQQDSDAKQCSTCPASTNSTEMAKCLCKS